MPTVRQCHAYSKALDNIICEPHHTIADVPTIDIQNSVANVHVHLASSLVVT